jgi:hypothetical protein
MKALNRVSYIGIMEATSTKTKAFTINVGTDYARGPKRFIFSWNGFNKELFNGLRQAGAKADKVDNKWIIWCFEDKFPSCMRILNTFEATIKADFDVDEQLAKTIAESEEPYTIVSVTNMNVIIHFEYNVPMLEALKATVPSGLRDYDKYTRDWIIRHEAIPALIGGWRALNIPVTTLEGIRRIIT